MTGEERLNLLDQLHDRFYAEDCSDRSRILPGRGSCSNGVMVLAQANGSDDDLFSQETAQLLDGVLQSADLVMDECYITALACPGNRCELDLEEETLPCQNRLEALAALLNPKIILAFGDRATKLFLYHSVNIVKLRGTWCRWKGIDLMPLLPLSTMLANPTRSKEGPKYLTWQDMLAVRKRLDEVTG